MNDSNVPQETANPPTAAPRADGAAPPPRVVSDPGEVANLVLWYIDAVNDRKSELTTSIKSLTDLVKQLLRAYSDHTQTIRALQARIKELEAGAESTAVGARKVG